MNETDRSSIKLRLVSPVLMWVIVLAGVLFAFLVLSDKVLFGRTWVSAVLFGLALVNWLYFLIGAIAVNRSAARSAAGIRRVVTTGVYAKVRHPIYSADILLAWGIFLMFPTLKILASVIWLTIVMIFWMKLEESALTERFGEEYTRYKSRTPMFIPAYLRKR